MSTTSPPTATVHVLRVFTNAQGRYGNPLGVVLDGASVPADGRQALAARLGYSETVYVDGFADGGGSRKVQIFTPTSEIPMAGHPLVGTAWLLAQQDGTPSEFALSPVRLDSPVPCAVSGARARIDVTPSTAPDWELEQLADPGAVESAAVPGRGEHWQRTLIWAWDDAHDEPTVRARTFAWAWGVEEDEACGSGVVRLAALLGHGVRARTGRGSVVEATMRPDGLVRVGGRVVLDGRREEPVGA
ncbi:PhzF family phenazine biosynthesis protein [Streptomyces sp. CB03238]|uniref:PhzF family phenazine biosynthesis protein n=1 Tax=Streptomyces sp. CB03238 TaxID=1907777 RepID=UPI0015C4564E|nr:PhzF family phenazine biosynthesis protein [Streptomyces sp. CB03238]